MSPRAFRTMLVGPMGTKDRLELESRVLAAALKQSVELGDNQGVSLAHRQIFLLIRSAHGSSEKATERDGSLAPSAPESADNSTGSGEAVEAAPPVVKKRNLPDIVWTEAEEDDSEASLDTEIEPELEPSDETIEVPYSDEEVIEVIQNRSVDNGSSQDDSSGEESNPVETHAVSTTRAKKSQPQAHLDENVFDAYGIIGVEQVASFEKIHVGFLLSIRRLLFKMKKTRRKKRKEYLNQLQELWIAHDVLTDPVTRTDYDFRILGLRGAPDVIIDSPDSEGQVMIGSSIPLRIGELLQCAGLLEPTELEIAADMHKAMPEMLFGAFLVKQGFITEPDLDQVLMGQRLLKMGYMSVATFQTCMKHWIDSDMPIYESAVTEGLLTLSEMERIIAQGLKDTDTEIPAIQGGGQVGFRSGARAKVQAIGTGPMLNEEEARRRQVSADHAVPEWKDQLDWSAPPEEEAPKPVKPRREVKATMDNTAYHIEGVTSPRPEGGSERKSLRSLMRGMHMSDDSEDESSEDNAGSLQQVLAQGKSTIDFDVSDVQEEEEVRAEVQGDTNYDGSGDVVSEETLEAPSLVDLAPSEVTAETPQSNHEVAEREPATSTSEELNTLEVDEEASAPEFKEEFSQNFEENYDEEDEPVMDFEDSLELPMPTEEVGTSAQTDRVEKDTETFSNLDKVQESDSPAIDMRLSGERYPVSAGGVSGASSPGAALGENFSPPEDGDQLEEEETTEEIKQIALTLKRDEEERGAGDEEESDAQEAARQALKKSIEWQVMYKIRGSLADMLLSDSEEPDMPPLAPRLEDIDVIPKDLGRAESSESDDDGEAGSSKDSS